MPKRPPRATRPKSEDPLVRLAVRIPKSLHQRLKVYAATSQIPMQDIVTAILSKSPMARALGRIPKLIDRNEALGNWSTKKGGTP